MDKPCEHKNNKNRGDIVNIYGLQCLDCGEIRYYDVLIRRVTEEERGLMVDDKVREREKKWQMAKTRINFYEMVRNNTEEHSGV